jgi:hypothetical protein
MDKPKKSFVSNTTQLSKTETNEIHIKSSENHDKSEKSDIDIYIDNFNPLEKIAYEIAKSRLKTSFDIEKSIGYIKK